MGLALAAQILIALWEWIEPPHYFEDVQRGLIGESLWMSSLFWI